MTNTSNAPIRLGILGAARIARLFVEGARPAARAEHGALEIVGVAARDEVRAQAFARDLGLPRTWPDYDALIADPTIDAVYIPLPNSLHAEWAIKAAAAGKHVLSEKPLAGSEADARAMFAAARKAGVVLVEGYPYLAQAQTLKARDLAASGAIGRLRLIRTAFGVPIPDEDDIRYSAELDGGAMMDAGSYAVSMMRVIAGERPIRVTAVADWAEGGVDRTMLATIEFQSGLLAQVAASFATAYHRHAQIAGEDGIIETTYLNHPPLGGPPLVHIRRGRTAQAEAETLTLEGGNGFLAEALSFARAIRSGSAHWTGASESVSLDVAATLDALRASARTRLPVSVAPAVTTELS